MLCNFVYGEFQRMCEWRQKITALNCIFLKESFSTKVIIQNGRSQQNEYFEQNMDLKLKNSTLLPFLCNVTTINKPFFLMQRNVLL